MALTRTVPPPPAASPRGERLLPSPAMVRRLLDYYLARYRRTWRASVVTAFLQPALYLLAMGVFLGGYVDDTAGSAARLGGVSYLDFVAPGLLCATAMQFSAGESLWPVMGALKWNRTYHSMVATPLSVAEIVAGALIDVAVRTGLSVLVFVLVLVPFGVFDSPASAVAAFAVGLLTAFTSVALFFSFSVRVQSEYHYGLMFRLGIFPLFLFSGAFFPVENLPDALEWIAKVSPLWHAVEAARQVSLDAGALATGVFWGHVAVLVALLVLGFWLGVRGLRDRLVV